MTEEIELGGRCPKCNEQFAECECTPSKLKEIREKHRYIGEYNFPKYDAKVVHQIQTATAKYILDEVENRLYNTGISKEYKDNDSMGIGFADARHKVNKILTSLRSEIGDEQ